VTFNDPVTVNDPVIIADPVNGNAGIAEPVATVIGKVVPLPFVKVIVFEDTDAVIISLATNEAVDAKDELIEVVAKELDKALVAKDAVPNKDPVNAVDVNEVNPVIVVAVAPSDIEVDPTVTELFAKFAFVIPAVPLKLALVNPEIEPPSVNDPEEVTVPVSVIPDTVP
jgi:hypothetical protein